MASLDEITYTDDIRKLCTEEFDGHITDDAILILNDIAIVLLRDIVNMAVQGTQMQIHDQQLSNVTHLPLDSIQMVVFDLYPERLDESGREALEMFEESQPIGWVYLTCETTQTLAVNLLQAIQWGIDDSTIVYLNGVIFKILLDCLTAIQGDVTGDKVIHAIVGKNASMYPVLSAELYEHGLYARLTSFTDTSNTIDQLMEYTMEML